MSLSIQKLQRLWENRSKHPGDLDLTERCDQIEKIINGWEIGKATSPEYTPPHCPEDEGIPCDNWNIVKDSLRKYYDSNQGLKGQNQQIEDVSDLFHLQSRDWRFRISSNAAGNSDHESPTTTPTQSNPESFFASYNYPFEIIRFFFSCRESPAINDLKHKAENRFIVKFIWMLANSAQYLPILSIRSFRELAPLFHDISPNLDWGQGYSYYWSLSFNDFIQAWPEVSEQISSKITGTKYSCMSIPDKNALWRMLFLVSVVQTSARNAFDMIQTGNKAMIMFGPPGTGKTFHAKGLARELLSLRLDENLDGVSDASFQEHQFTTAFNELDRNNNQLVPVLKHGCWELVQFHPSYSYHDFMGGIMPNLEGKNLSYMKRKGVFMRFCEAAEKFPSFPFVFIIDEINRADLSSVFGELMYTLEYRGESVDTVQFGAFNIPKNVYLIGTMNTADKSLVSFDLALRRRFTFMKLLPDLDCLHDWNLQVGFPENEIDQLIERAKGLNAALTDQREGLGLAEDFAIGQAYFMKICDFCPEDGAGSGRVISDFSLEQLWDYHLESLIEEYLGSEAAIRKDKVKELRTRFTLSIKHEG